jgi:hypothetical protein
MNDDSGSFMIKPSLKGRDAIDFAAEDFIPFCIGDVNPGGMFIHVFDDVAIRRVLEHLTPSPTSPAISTNGKHICAPAS